MRNHHLLLAGAMTIAIAALTSCSLSADTKAAEQSVDNFHRMLDAGQFDAIYDGTTDTFKQATSHDDFVRLLEAVHRKLGNSRSSKEVNWSVFSGTSGSRVNLFYKTDFEKGTAEETFAWTLDSNQPKLIGYRINSNTLVVN